MAFAELPGEWDGAAYASIAELQHAIGEDFADGLRLTGTESVLDIGSGDGRTTARVAARLTTGRILGIDPSRSMVRQARLGAPVTVNYTVADLSSFHGRWAEHRLARFDLVISLNALHWIVDLAQALRQVRDLTRPGGMAVLQLVGAGAGASIEDVLTELIQESTWATAGATFTRPYQHGSAATYRDLSRSAGFATAEVDQRRHRWDFGSREGLAAWLTLGAGAWLDLVPVGERAAFIDVCVERYERQMAGEEGVVHFEQLRVTAT